MAAQEREQPALRVLGSKGAGMGLRKFSAEELTESKRQGAEQQARARAYLQAIIDLRDWHHPAIVAFADKLARETHFHIESARLAMLAQMTAYLDAYEVAFNVGYELGYESGESDTKLKARPAKGVRA